MQWSLSDAREFQSTHPVRGGTRHLEKVQDYAKISIHPPREGWDRFVPYLSKAVYDISIHPPREGWDAIALNSRQQPHNFNPPTP